MRTRSLFIVLTLAAASLVLSAQSPQLRLVSTAWSPFTNAPGQPRFALDLVETALGRIKVTANTTFVEPAQFTPALLTGPYDGSAAAWKDAEREKVLLFSEPYLENRLILVGRKGADVRALTLGALKGKRVAIVGGYAYGDIESAGPTFVRSLSEEDSLTQLLQSKVDYALMDELVVQYIVSNYAKEAQTRLQLGMVSLVTRPLYLAVRRSLPDAASLIARFNAQLRSMIVDRTYHKLLHVDWIRADIDGDGVPETVPLSDNIGKTPPQQVYSLSLKLPKPGINPREIALTQRFYLGGTIYTDWASVPNKYKIDEPHQPDSGRHTASVFKFVW
jgi:polar amino acid transport system substrate-binding protein